MSVLHNNTLQNLNIQNLPVVQANHRYSGFRNDMGQFLQKQYEDVP